jgi:pyruvate/2-oxoglutarate dehydrogenase complex dihydrolipoamide acyltransferase (E2) component
VQAAALAGAAELSTALAAAAASAAAAAAAAAAAPQPLVAATRLSESVFLDGARDHTRLCASEDERGRARKMRTSGGAARGGGRVLLEGLEAILLPELCQVLHPAAVSAHVHADEHAGLSTPLGCRLGWACPRRLAGAPLLVLVHLRCGRSASPPPKGKWPILHLSPGAGGPAAAPHDGLPRARSSRRPELCAQLHAPPHTTLPG